MWRLNQKLFLSLFVLLLSLSSVQIFGQESVYDEADQIMLNLNSHIASLRQQISSLEDSTANLKKSIAELDESSIVQAEILKKSSETLAVQETQLAQLKLELTDCIESSERLKKANTILVTIVVVETVVIVVGSIILYNALK